MALATPIEPRARDHTTAHAARIGPNAVTQLIPALRRAGLEAQTARLFDGAGAGDWMADPPSGMVDAARVAQVHRAVRAALPRARSEAVLAEAGRLTAEYLLANRIPRAAQAVLRCLPPAAASRLLVPAIAAHAWTFAGAGAFSAVAGAPSVIEIAGNPLCAGERADTPVCAWHAAVFQRLFRALVSSRTRVREVACEACGDACCRFVADWRDG